MALVFDLLGRRAGLAAFALLSAVLFICLDFCLPSWARDALFLLLRCCTLSQMGGAYILTQEAFPTVLRSSGSGLCSAFARLAGLVTPFAAQVSNLRFNTTSGQIIQRLGSAEATQTLFHELNSKEIRC